VIACAGREWAERESRDMASNSIQNNDVRPRPHDGAIYRDRLHNIIRLLSIGEDYCSYVYVHLTNLQSAMHGVVTGLSRRDVFESSFIFVAGCLEDWSENELRDAGKPSPVLQAAPEAVQSASPWLELGRKSIRFGAMERPTSRENPRSRRLL
jgi:hypothetical protein